MILYIDDEPQLPAGFEDDVQAEGFRLVHVDDPEMASRLVRVDDPDLVLMEVVLSSCDGLSLLDAIRSYGGWPAQVPIIVITKGERTPELYGRALEMDVKEFLTKPVLKSQLLESVRKFAGQRPEPEPTLSGDLADFPISEVLHCLRQDAATGVLIATHRKTQRSIQLRNGSPMAISTTGGVEAPEDFLARRNRITEKQRLAVKEQAAARNRSSGEVLIAMGAVSEENLNAALRCQAEEQLLQTFRWDSGPFGFFPDMSIEAKSKLALDCNPAELIVLGIQHGSPPQTVSEALRDRAALYVSREEKPPYEFGSIQLSSAERVFFEHMNGDRSVRDVLDSGEFSERLLYALFVAGFLVFHRDPVMMLFEELGEAREAPSRPVESRVSRRAAPIRARSQPHRPLRESPPSAPPVATGGGSLPVLPATRGAEAEHLQSGDSRRAYAALSREEQKDREKNAETSRAFEAESGFRKGEGFLKAKKYDRAVEAFGMSAHLDPDEGEYAAHLGYALFLSQPKDPIVLREALEHIAKGIKLSPQREMSYVYLGRIFRTNGAAHRARKMFERAVRINPDCHAALLELRILERHERRSGGFLKRLLKR